MAEVAEAARSTVDPRLAALKRIAIVPALNEQESIARVIDEILAFDPGLEIVVIDDGSVDRTAAVAEQKGAHVIRLPYNLGIGGSVQTGFRYAFDNGFRIAVRLDADGQHDASQLAKLVQPVLADEADIAVGSRFAAPSGYRSSMPRRAGITILAKTVSLLVGRRVTDPTSGFQALNRHAIALFAADYPHDIPEVEAVLMTHKHRLRMIEVPVEMRERASGRSSIGRIFAVYYMVKVLLALFVGLFRKNVTPLEDVK
jgi:glycosyltransferase involved in cell wall biosynthesis